MKTIHLKLANLSDQKTLLPMIRAYHQFEALETSEQERVNALTQLLESPELGKIWLIQSDTIPIGYIALCPGYTIEFGGRDAFIDEFFILPEFRGKGYGKQTLSLVKKEATQWGINALFLEVAKDNTIAQHLYTSVGFKPREKYTLMNVKL